MRSKSSRTSRPRAVSTARSAKLLIEALALRNFPQRAMLGAGHDYAIPQRFIAGLDPAGQIDAGMEPARGVAAGGKISPYEQLQ